MFNAIFARRSHARLGQRKARPSRRVKPALETLEDRVTPAVAVDVLSDGQLLLITGDAMNNKVFVSADTAGNVRVSNKAQNGKTFFEGNLLSLVNVQFLGNDGDDLFNAGNVVDLFTVSAEGGNGNDILVGGAGLNDFRGDDGDDQLTGGAGNDSLQGGAGADVLRGLDGFDFLAGGDDNDLLEGGDGDDELSGDPGSDAFNGGLGTDRLNFDTDDVNLLGGGDSDVFVNLALTRDAFDSFLAGLGIHDFDEGAGDTFEGDEGVPS